MMYLRQVQQLHHVHEQSSTQCPHAASLLQHSLLLANWLVAYKREKDRIDIECNIGYASFTMLCISPLF